MALGKWPIGLAVALAAALIPSQAFAQNGGAPAADRLCTASPRDAADGERFPASAVLSSTADAIEQMLNGLRARGDASPADPAALAVALTEETAPEPLALARYCAAAGELMRLSARGSQRQAQHYLLAAYRLATASGDALASRPDQHEGDLASR